MHRSVDWILRICTACKTLTRIQNNLLYFVSKISESGSDSHFRKD